MDGCWCHRVGVALLRRVRGWYCWLCWLSFCWAAVFYLLRPIWVMAWLGFSLLFGAAAIRRLVSAKLLWHMHGRIRIILVTGLIYSNSPAISRGDEDRTFQQYSLFIASMNAMVAISSPVRSWIAMLLDLQFTYFTGMFYSQCGFRWPHSLFTSRDDWAVQ